MKNGILLFSDNLSVILHTKLYASTIKNKTVRKDAGAESAPQVQRGFKSPGRIGLTKLTLYFYISQSAENRRKECHRFWLSLRHTVILISNDRISASMKINRMVLIRTLTILLLCSKESRKNSTVFGRL